MSIITVEIDLAKNNFAVHGVDQKGKAVLIYSKVLRDVESMVADSIDFRHCSGGHSL